MKAAAKQPAVRPTATRKPLEIEYWSLSDLKPFARNPNEHSDEQVAGIADGIRQFGFLVPVVIDAKGVIADGHGRVLAAKLLKLKSVPVVVAGYLSTTQRKAFMVASNKLQKMGRWNEGLLSELLAELETSGVDLHRLAFSDDELKRLKDDVDRAAMSAMESGPASAVRAHTRGGKEAAAEPAEEVQQFSVLLNEDQRKEIYAAVRAVKARDGNPRTADALHTICKEWSHAESKRSK